MELTEGIYSYVWHGIWENNGNMFYFADPLNILIDPGMRYLFDVQAESLKKDGINLTDIKYVFNTHCHPDHLESSAEFAERPDVKIGMHPEEISFYGRTKDELSKMLNIQLPDINFSLELKEGSMDINGTELQIIHTPGHTPGSISIYWPEKKALACGDLLFDHSFNRRDLPGTDYGKLCESIERLMALDIEYLMPGHTGVQITPFNVEARLRHALEDFSMFV